MKNTISNTVRNSFVAIAMLVVLALPIASAKAADLGGYTTYPSGVYTTAGSGSYTTYPSQSYTTYPSKSYTTYPSQSYTTYPSQSYTTYPSQSYTTYPSQSYTTYPSQAYTTYPSQAYTTYSSQAYTTYPSQSSTYYPSVSYTDYSNDYSSASYSNQVDYVGGSSFDSGYTGGVSFIGGSNFGPSTGGCGILGCGNNDHGCTHDCNPKPPKDVCPNLSGTQTYVPDGYELKNGKCKEVQDHYAYNPPTYYPQQPSQPYVTLSQVPYTGLDLDSLGPVGKAVFYSFFVLAAFLAIYIVKMVVTYRAIKRG